jgi:hypothetical protein
MTKKEMTLAQYTMIALATKSNISEISLWESSNYNFSKKLYKKLVSRDKMIKFPKYILKGSKPERKESKLDW